MRTFLSAFFELFRVIKRYRERQEARFVREAEERAAERAHQRALLETIFTKLVESQKVTSESVMALADAQRSQANVMQTWLDGFKISDPTPVKPQVVRPEEEWVKEQLRLNEIGLADAALQLPPEFQLAFELSKLNQDSLEDFDREGSDF
jgi:hypothetical protein